jgi:hypothetical protein
MTKFQDSPAVSLCQTYGYTERNDFRKVAIRSFNSAGLPSGDRNTGSCFVLSVKQPKQPRQPDGRRPVPPAVKRIDRRVGGGAGDSGWQPGKEGYNVVAAGAGH